MYSEDGFDYEEKHKESNADNTERIVEDKIGITEIKKEMAEKKK